MGVIKATAEIGLGCEAILLRPTLIINRDKTVGACDIANNFISAFNIAAISIIPLECQLA
jgi:hypothetical protein